jgi:hypothetical protein
MSQMIDGSLDFFEARSGLPLSPLKGCCRCGEDRAAAMTKRGRCYACDRLSRGLPAVEQHHVFGPSRPETVLLPVNDHRCLDALRQARWPAQLREPTGDLSTDTAALLLLFVELAEMELAAVERDKAPQWRGELAKILATQGQAAVAALLKLGAEP